jgi:NACHT domain-containing protein
LFLRDHIAAISQENPPSLGELAQAHFSNKRVCGKAPPEQWFEKQLRAGRCMVLLDGLDEVAKLEQRQAVSRWVDAQVGNYPECPFVLTSRPQGYKDAPLARADVLEVQPLNVKQVIQFIESWYLANEIKGSGNQLNPDVRYRARRDAHDLMQRLQQTPSVNALTVNPLLLTMVAMVHRYHGALPGSRIELYKEICEVLLGRWRQAKGVQDDLKAAQKLVVLQTLAAHMMENERRDISAEEAMQVIATPLERIGVTGLGRVEFLEKLRESSGLVQEREAGKWSFAHQTFQEYLAATQWLEQKEARRDWRRLVARSWWREMLRLYASQGDATELVKACLDVASVDALMLAADCLEEARELAPEVRRKAEERVIAGLDASDPARQHLAAEVKLARRLKSLQPIDNEQAIDLKHLTCAEYQLFLDDMRAAGKYHQPDHWLGSRFPKGQGHEPVCGVQAADAVEFCKWLTRRSGGSVRYRLPRLEEARAHPGESARLGTWCHDGTRPAIECADEARRVEAAHVMGWQSLHELARDRDLAFALTHNLVRALDVVLDRTLILALALNRDLELAHDLALTRDLVVARARALDDALALLRSFEFTLDQDLQRARTLARSTNEFVEFHPEIQMEYLSLLSRIREQAPKVVEASGGVHDTSWLAGLMDALLGVAAAQTVLTMREAQRVLLDRVLEYGLTAATEPLPILQRVRCWLDTIVSSRKAAVATRMDLQALRNGLRLMLAREEGQSAAWEGIRLVREPMREQSARANGPGMDVTPYATAA